MKHGKIFILCPICNTKVNLGFIQFKKYKLNGSEQDVRDTRTIKRSLG